MVMTPPAIKSLALESGLQVWQPEKLRGSDELSVFAELDFDVIVVMAYGQILPKVVIDSPALACINLHASLLPRFRGASCIQGPIDAGDEETGVTVMHVAPALDEGDVILQHKLKLEPDHTGGVVHDILAERAPAALLEALTSLFDGSAAREEQDDSLSCYAPKLMRKDGEIGWTMSADALERRIRAFDPWPGTSTSFIDAKGKQRRLKIFPQTSVKSDLIGKPGEVLELSKDGLLVACGKGAIRIQNLQPEGSARMDAASFAAGNRLKTGDVLG